MKAKINGKEMFYEVQGKGEPLILIHGLGITHEMWGWQVKDLKKDFQVIVYDLPGHGGTENILPEKEIYRGLVDDLKGLMDHLGLEQANLCGLSLGGRVALAMAIHEPERVKRLIISSTFDKIQGIGETFTTWLGTRMLKKMTLERIVKTSAKSFFPTPELQKAAQLYSREAMKVQKEAILRLSYAASEVDYSSGLTLINVPTLVFVGEKEKAMIKIARRIAKAIPHAQLEVIPGVGHIWNLEKPELFSEKVRGFLKK
jgi:pimeloyl-ACP methyl ester carboxylesterase